MQITKDAVVSFEYTLTDPAGTVLDRSGDRGPLSYLHGRGQIVPGLEAELEGKSAGETLRVTVPPERAYGRRHEQLTQTVPRATFPAGQMIMVGQRLNAKGPQGQAIQARVTKVSDAEVTVDANHPLAGVTLTFDVTVKAVRAATPDELSHGHAHGPGGHQH